MKTIYLKSSTKSDLIADIAQVIEGYAGEIEFSNGTIHGHWIGKIPDSSNEDDRVESDRIHTIEGNTNDEGDREGYEVARRVRKISSCKGFIRII